MNDPAPHEPGRHSIRLKGFDYSAAGGYFVTLVTHGREGLFGEIKNGGMQLSDLGRIAEENWRAIPDHFPNVELGEYVIMPNHVHGNIILVGATHWVAPPTVAPSTVAPPTVAPPTGAPPTGAAQTIVSSRTKPNGPKCGSIGAIVGAYKMSVTRRIQEELNGANIWQRNFYEHILRNQADYERIAAYILENPANWNLDEENPQKTIGKENIPGRD